MSRTPETGYSSVSDITQIAKVRKQSEKHRPDVQIEVGRMGQTAQVQANDQENTGEDNSRHKTAAVSKQLPHSCSTVLCLHRQSARAVQGVQQFKAPCQQMRPEGDKGL